MGEGSAATRAVIHLQHQPTLIPAVAIDGIRDAVDGHTVMDAKGIVVPGRIEGEVEHLHERSLSL